MLSCPECGCCMGHTPVCTYTERHLTKSTSAASTQLCCEHGSLARSCEICDLQAQLLATQLKLEKAREALTSVMNAYGDPHAEDDVTMTARECLAAIKEGEGGS